MKLDDNGGLDALLSCGGLDNLKQNLHSSTPVASQPQGDMARMDLNLQVYLGKPTTPGKQDGKPLLISDFVDAYSGSLEPSMLPIDSEAHFFIPKIVWYFKEAVILLHAL